VDIEGFEILQKNQEGCFVVKLLGSGELTAMVRYTPIPTIANAKSATIIMAVII
jgi:hypothetical protein